MRGQAVLSRNTPQRLKILPESCLSFVASHAMRRLVSHKFTYFMGFEAQRAADPRNRRNLLTLRPSLRL